MASINQEEYYLNDQIQTAYVIDLTIGIVDLPETLSLFIITWIEIDCWLTLLEFFRNNKCLLSSIQIDHISYKIILENFINKWIQQDMDLFKNWNTFSRKDYLEWLQLTLLI